MGGQAVRVHRFHARWSYAVRQSAHLLYEVSVMTSEERREIRYQNRRRAREQKRSKLLSQYDDYNRVINCSALVAACRQSQKGVSWKASVQRYLMNLLRNTAALHRDLKAEKDVSQGFIEFDICERGKIRHVKSVHFKERVVQRSLCDNALVPVLKQSLIYDNGASLEGKGIHFSLNRAKAHLQKYYRQNGFSNQGYVLVIDFSKYFDNIEHQPVYDKLNRSITDHRIIDLCTNFIRPFGEKSVGIGSQISQIIAVAYPDSIDHFIKQDLGIKFYARYMDDSYLIHSDKEYLKYCLDVLKEKYAGLGIVVNQRKTRILKLSNGFTFLKTRYILTDTGQVIMKPCKSSIVRMRRKLKKFKRMMDNGEMTLEDIQTSYRSWKGYISHTNSHKSVYNMDLLYIKLFKSFP